MKPKGQVDKPKREKQKSWQQEVAEFTLKLKGIWATQPILGKNEDTKPIMNKCKCQCHKDLRIRLGVFGDCCEWCENPKQQTDVCRIPNCKDCAEIDKREESTGGDWEDDFVEQLRMPKGNFSNKERWLVEYVKALISEERKKVRGELIAEIDEIVDDCSSTFAYGMPSEQTVDYDEFAERVLEWLDKKLKGILG